MRIYIHLSLAVGTLKSMELAAHGAVDRAPHPTHHVVDLVLDYTDGTWHEGGSGFCQVKSLWLKSSVNRKKLGGFNCGHCVGGVWGTYDWWGGEFQFF